MRAIDETLEAWILRYRLTCAETALLALLVDGYSSSHQLAAKLRCSRNTVKCQAKSLLYKAGGDESGKDLAIRFLREALENSVRERVNALPG